MTAPEFLKIVPKDVTVPPPPFISLYVCDFPSLEVENGLEINFSPLLLTETKSPLLSLYLVMFLIGSIVYIVRKDEVLG